MECSEYRTGFAQAAADVYQFLRESPGVLFRRFLDFVLVFPFARTSRNAADAPRGKAREREEDTRLRHTDMSDNTISSSVCSCDSAYILYDRAYVSPNSRNSITSVSPRAFGENAVEE